MARKPYLEFSVADRRASAKLYSYGLKNGWFERPSKEGGCTACFQTKGPIETHREDYSQIEPNDSLVVICYRCHRVLHMRDRYPEGWEFYRDRIREGWQYQWTKDIGPAAGDMRAKNPPRFKPNEARERTILDDIHDGILLKGTPEERQERLKEIHRRWAEIENRGQQGLF